MDPYDELLRGVRTDEVRFRRVELSPPWTLPLRPAADSLTLVAPLRGGGWCEGGPDEEGARPRRFGAHDAVILRGPGRGRLTDRPRDGAPADAPERTVLLVGTYRVTGELSRRLLGLLPPTLLVDGEEDDCAPLMDFLDAQVAGSPPEQQAVLDRLFDWLLVCTLRSWFDGQEAAAAPGLPAALGDPVVGPALRALHAAPERPWTLAALAREAGVSRTTLAGRFTRLVGEPPLAYLTEWRMSLAADLLTDSTAPLASVARRVGYADAFGFSTAFKRVHGTSPSTYRGSHRTPAPHPDPTRG
ncbi:AraC-type DNA-binding protein [Streptomyces zhaozhouensis]|uniref:AraC-type DNA-binding protein n=1 Tax=Streptomyces zhaozhouensis TaxID=1300267 RepID=A0A286DJ30_9ACTN|nr:AraC family transcriptional regulator [Streptomyces zhaozhouensis]SOD58601.1 AraC-type DNA-binding protein [Streptomyces zhaozhouensis]